MKDNHLFQMTELKSQLLSTDLSLVIAIEEFARINSDYAISQSENPEPVQFERYSLSKEGRRLLSEKEKVDKSLEKALRAMTLVEIGVKFTPEELQHLLDQE